jgi:bifunctional oligoribonuclease and PAP phosphatase NrnA
VFIEQFDGGTKVSFRARSKVNVAEIAAYYGGGGHQLASGARLPGPISEARENVLAKIETALAAISGATP